MSRLSILVAVAVLSFSGQTFGQACPSGEWCQWTVVDGGKDHWYRLTATPSLWHVLQEKAVDAGGYLAAIGSPEENLWILNNLAIQTPDVGIAIGLVQDCGDLIGGDICEESPCEPTGCWEWINGEPKKSTRIGVNRLVPLNQTTKARLRTLRICIGSIT